MNAPSTDIAAMLADVSGPGLTEGTNLFISILPELPDAIVAVFDYSGSDPEQNFAYWRPSVQVRVRGAREAYEAAYQLAMDIRAYLVASHNVTINGSRYIGIWAKGDIISLGRDGNNRPELSVNFAIHRTTV